MDFWTKQNSLSVAELTAAGKEARYERKWRSTIVYGVGKLDVLGEVAVRTAYLHICTRIGASAIADRETKIVALQRAAAEMTGDETTVTAVPAKPVKAFIRTMLEQAAVVVSK